MIEITSKKIYFDSCCFIDMVKANLKKPDKSLDAERLKDCHYLKAICDAARNKELTIFASTLCLAECTHISGKIDEEIKDLFEKFLGSGEVVIPISADFHVGILARNLRWKHGISLSGADMLHVASAISVGCQEFITTDGRIKKTRDKPFGTALPLLQKLELNVIRASSTALLPTKYLQNKLFDAQHEEKSDTTE